MKVICSKCGSSIDTVDHGIGTGYSTTESGEKVCYECIGKLDRTKLYNLPIGGKYTLYLTEKKRHLYVSNWPGSFKLPVHYSKTGNHNIAGIRQDVWFYLEDHLYHGTCYGKNTQIAYCKRIKK
jgi:hypothetical protein